MARKRLQEQKNKSSQPHQQRRQHFGQGDLAAEPATSVFINCPFDGAYARLFDALVFAVTCCGFLARSALESGNVAENRMNRIARAVFSSKYSIHDLSRCQGEGEQNIARFNMPLELGIAMGRRMAHGDDQHDWLILVPEGHLYARFISDLAGHDPKTHNGTVESMVPKVMAWLATRRDAVYVPTPNQVLAAFPAFEERKRELITQWHEEVPWADQILAARECVPE